MAKKPPVNRRVQRARGRKLVTPRSVSLADIRDIRQARRKSPPPSVRSGQVPFGVSGTQNILGRIYGEDYNRLFDGKLGIAIYDQMGRSDAQTGAAADIIKLPLRSSSHKVIPPEDPTKQEIAIADACNLALFEPGVMRESWDFYYRHLLMRIDYGFGLLEKEWMFDEDSGVYRFARLHPRLPKTVDKWDTDNRTGVLRNIVQYTSIDGRLVYLTIPAEFAVLSSREREGDNWFGKSIYRRIYKHWFYKDEAYRIDGIRLDRYGVGIPVATIAEGHSVNEGELDEIEDILQNMRSNARAYFIETSGVTFRILVPEGQGGASGLNDSVEHHDQKIVTGVLATFISDHQEGLNTNRTSRLADIFLHSLKAEAAAIDGDIDTQLVRPFCDVNFDMSVNRYPRKVTSGLSDITIEQLATVLQPFVTAGLIQPDDNIEAALRKLLSLPPLLDGYKRGDVKPEPVAPGTDQNADGSGDGAGDPGDKSASGGDGKKPNTSKPVAASARPKVVPLFNPDQARDDNGRFADSGGGGSDSGGSDTGGSSAGGSDRERLAAVSQKGVMTHEARSANVMTHEEATDPKFHEALTIAHEAAQHPDASEFEKQNPVVVARAFRESNRPFEELHAGGSAAFFRDPDTGGYKPERQAEHEAIIAHFESKFGPPQESPKAIVTGGLPGAGKTVGLKMTVPDLDQYVSLNSDDVKGMLSGFNGTNAGWVHEESDHVIRIIQKRALDQRQNVIIDVTMKNAGGFKPSFDDGTSGQILALKEAGYHVSAQFTEVDLKTSSERAMQRYVREGRFVPPTYIRSAKSDDPQYSSKNRQAFEQLKPILDSWRHFDSRVPKGQPPKLVAQSSGE